MRKRIRKNLRNKFIFSGSRIHDPVAVRRSLIAYDVMFATIGFVHKICRESGEENREVCDIAVVRRDGFERAPQMVEPNTRVCFNCYQSIVREIRIIEENPMSVKPNVLNQTRNNSCFICNNVNNLYRLSIDCKVQAFVLCNIFFSETVRSCDHHLDEREYILQPLLAGLQCINR